MTRAFCSTLSVILVSSSAMAAATIPSRQSGLWEIMTMVDGKPMGTGPLQQCIDSKTDDMMGQNMAGIVCERNAVARAGPVLTIDSVCKIGKTRTTTKGTFTGDFAKAYKANLAITYDPPMMGMKAARMSIDARRLGPCKPGQRPGQIIMPK